MTVCVATLFNWNYAPKGQSPDYRLAAAVASDRMITAGDVQYEPQQTKVAYVSNTLIVIAGDYSLHSQVVRRTLDNFYKKHNPAPLDVALFYGRAIQSIKQRYAEDIYLSPLGLNLDTFHAQQKDFAEPFLNRITDQLQSFRGEDVEALVVGSNGKFVELYAVDTNGSVNYSNDVGFAAIGIGAWHAKSRLMQSGYTSSIPLAPALAALYAAKKSAEAAPGVGKATDIHLVLNTAPFPLWPRVAGKLDELYNDYESKRTALGAEAIALLDKFIVDDSGNAKDEKSTGKPSGDAQTNERIDPSAAEASRKNEGGEKT